MKKGFVFFLILFLALQSKAQLVINEVSQGTSGNKEYVELVVTGIRTCTDTAADIRGWIIDDNGGWFGSSAISQGCYRFANVPAWSHVPFGSIILFYNDGDKNGLITQADDVTDANGDGVYIVPVTSPAIELNGSSPNSGMGSTFNYPSTGFGASTSWTPMALNNNGDAVAVINPAAPGVPHHAMTYGNISGGVHVSGSGGQKVYYVSGSQYNATAGWISGSAPSEETPGAPNTTANRNWINSFKSSAGGGAPYNDTTKVTICDGQSYTFNGNIYTIAGIYSFTYHQPSGCDSIITLNLTVKPTPAPPTAISPAYCQEDIVGPLAATGTNLLWYTVPGGGTGSATAPVPVTTTTGTISWYVSQTVNGCESKRTQINVTIKPKPAPPVVVSPVSYCQRAIPVPLIATGTDLLWYTLSTGGTASSIIPVPQTTTPGTTSWFATQTQNGCESNRSRIDVTVHEIKAAFTVNKDTVCSNDTLKVTNASSGNGLLYTWSFGDGGTAITPDAMHIYTTPGIRHVQLIAVNSAGCGDTANRDVFILPFPVLSFTTADSVICRGKAVNLDGQMSPYYKSISWDFGDGNQAYDQEQVQHSYDTSGSFVISVRTENRGCPDRFYTDTLTVHPYPVVNIGPDTALCPGNAPLLLANAAFNPQALTYRWSTGAITDHITVSTPGVYWLEVSNGQCGNTDSIDIARSCYIDIPNSFTPNNDGLNDYFFPRNMLSHALVAFHMQVLNRWGQLVFETRSLDGRGWDGQFNNLGQPQGVYIYLIEATFSNGVQEKYQGNLSLLR